MNSFNNYYSVNELDKKWGLYILNAGYTNVMPNIQYPALDHPDGYQFKHEYGRVLNEFQMIYIASGSGVFESETYGNVQISANTVFFVFPNERHSYKPNKLTGWEEYWVGLSGLVIEQLYQNNFISKKNPTIKLYSDFAVRNLFMDIFTILKNENVGYQQISSGLVLQLLGLVHSFARQKEIRYDKYLNTINEAKKLFNGNNNLSPQKLAKELNIGYSLFRKLFKQYTGFSPNQYVIEMRINYAKKLLNETNLSVKEISFKVGFHSIYYFSKLFKKKCGKPPCNWRIG